MKRIMTRSDLNDFAREQGVRLDWHEPDEQDLTARVEGTRFDNAGFWPADPDNPMRHTELHVIFSRTVYSDTSGDYVPAEDLACVNLATLCAWATNPDLKD